MEYISGLHALNLPCSLETAGDWHCSSLQWKNPWTRLSEDSIFGEYGIEPNKIIPEHEDLYPVANHIRACLDFLEVGNFGLAQGMNKDFICNNAYNEEIFSQVAKLQPLPHWDEINDFMGKEYMRKWLRFTRRGDEDETMAKWAGLA